MVGREGEGFDSKLAKGRQMSRRSQLHLLFLLPKPKLDPQPTPLISSLSIPTLDRINRTWREFSDYFSREEEEEGEEEDLHQQMLPFRIRESFFRSSTRRMSS